MKGIGDFIDIVEKALLAVLFSAMLLLSLAQIVMRNLLDSGLIWADDAIKVLVLWLAMTGSVYASKGVRHIKIDLISRFLSKELSKISYGVAFVVTAVICAYASYHAYLFVLLEREYPEIAFLNVPTWVCELAIPVALVLMAIRFFGYAVLAFCGKFPTGSQQ